MSDIHLRRPPLRPLPAFELPPASPADPASLQSRVATRRPPASPRPLLRHLLFALLRQYDVKPGASLDFRTLVPHWRELGFSMGDLASVLIDLRHAGLMEPPARPDTAIVLTRSGHMRCHAPPRDLEDGSYRSQAARILQRSRPERSRSAA